VIGDLIRAYEAGRAARVRLEPFGWQPPHFRPAEREMWRLGWKDESHRRARGYPQLSLLENATLHLQSAPSGDNVMSRGNGLESARESHSG